MDQKWFGKFLRFETGKQQLMNAGKSAQKMDLEEDKKWKQTATAMMNENIIVLWSYDLLVNRCVFMGMC